MKEAEAEAYALAAQFVQGGGGGDKSASVAEAQRFGGGGNALVETPSRRKDSAQGGVDARIQSKDSAREGDQQEQTIIHSMVPRDLCSSVLMPMHQTETAAFQAPSAVFDTLKLVAEFRHSRSRRRVATDFPLLEGKVVFCCWLSTGIVFHCPVSSVGHVSD